MNNSNVTRLSINQRMEETIASPQFPNHAKLFPYPNFMSEPPLPNLTEDSARLNEFGIPGLDHICQTTEFLPGPIVQMYHTFSSPVSSAT